MIFFQITLISKINSLTNLNIFYKKRVGQQEFKLNLILILIQKNLVNANYMSKHSKITNLVFSWNQIIKNNLVKALFLEKKLMKIFQNLMLLIIIQASNIKECFNKNRCLSKLNIFIKNQLKHKDNKLELVHK